MIVFWSTVYQISVVVVGDYHFKGNKMTDFRYHIRDSLTVIQ